MRFEYLYDKREDTTIILMWKGTWLLHKKTIQGFVPMHNKPKIEKEMKDESNKG